MPVFGSQNFGSGGGTTYSIDKSCMFDYASGSYLSRTPGLAGNRKTWTMSVWLKMTRLASSTGGGLVVYKAGSTEFRWSDSNNNLYLNDGSVYKQTTSVARDFAAWFHLFIVADTPQSTASERFKVYINGTVPALTTDTAPAQDFEFDVNNTDAQNIGKEGGNYWDGYMADFHLIDGTAKAVGDFGETNDQGVWVPKKYTGGGYGTCGFHLDFADSADLGDDNSGQGNDFSLTNIAAAHQSSDTPTNNHCTLNGNYKLDGSITLSEGLQNYTNGAGAQDKCLGTMFPSTGKWYWEVKWVSGSSHGQVGLSQNDVGSNHELGSNNSTGTGVSLGYRSYDGNTYKNSTLTSFGATWTTGDIIGVAWDADNGKIYFAKNNSWQNSGDPTSGATGTGSAYTLSSARGTGGGWGPAVCNEGSSLYECRFDEAKWDYSAPTDFKALCTANMATPSIKDPSEYFQVVAYAGNGTAIGSGGKAVTFSGTSDMQPDMVWIKNRSSTDEHVAYDAARGTTKQVEPSNRSDETTQSEGLTAFGSDGFTLGSLDAVNTSGENFVAWCWNAGNSGAANTAGATNTTTTFSNATAGIFCSTYTGTGSETTFGHGLGQTPATWVCFQRSNNDHHNINNWETGLSAYTEKGNLDLDNYPEGSSSQMPAASSTTITVGSDPGINGSSRTYVAWGWAEIEGFSKFGTYTGNGNADGAFAYCGFKPAFAMIKRVDSSGGWVLKDTARSPDNEAHETLYANTNAANFGMGFDILSNGFKAKTTDSNLNASGGIYIFMAFAKEPIGGEDIAPSTAQI